eukprot:TRINITY_DN25388_c0_g1_i2.p1 TRINITY_DN25388_c0_g1~~TRINITY_DN25388_c0_g1_i2.p1  ORF type:complete len:774 (+),score=104.69 TRINITY_DN25388_c0_g1_i2:114-2435(+)
MGRRSPSSSVRRSRSPPARSPERSPPPRSLSRSPPARSPSRSPRRQFTPSPPPDRRPPERRRSASPGRSQLRAAALQRRRRRDRRDGSPAGPGSEVALQPRRRRRIELRSPPRRSLSGPPPRRQNLGRMRSSLSRSAPRWAPERSLSPAGRSPSFRRSRSGRRWQQRGGRSRSFGDWRPRRGGRRGRGGGREGGAKPEGCRTIWMGWFEDKPKQEDIEEFFKDTGSVTEVRTSEKNARGFFAHVQFEDTFCVDRAMKKSGEELKGTKVSLDYAYMDKVATERRFAEAPGSRRYRPKSVKPPNGHTLWIGDVSIEAEEQDLIDLFEPAGKIEMICLQVNQLKNGKFGHVKFFDTEGVDKAVELAGTAVKGVPIRLDYAEDKPVAAYRVGKDRHNANESNKPEGCRTVWIGGLSTDCTEDTIRDVFGKFGEIKEIRLDTSKRSGAYFCHVEYEETGAVDKAIKMSGERVNGAKIRIDFAENRRGDADRGDRGDRDRDRGKGPPPPHGHDPRLPPPGYPGHGPPPGWHPGMPPPGYGYPPPGWPHPPAGWHPHAPPPGWRPHYPPPMHHGPPPHHGHPPPGHAPPGHPMHYPPPGHPHHPPPGHPHHGLPPGHFHGGPPPGPGRPPEGGPPQEPRPPLTDRATSRSPGRGPGPDGPPGSFQGHPPPNGRDRSPGDRPSFGGPPAGWQGPGHGQPRPPHGGPAGYPPARPPMPEGHPGGPPGGPRGYYGDAARPSAAPGAHGGRHRRHHHGGAGGDIYSYSSYSYSYSVSRSPSRAP